MAQILFDDDNGIFMDSIGLQDMWFELNGATCHTAERTIEFPKVRLLGAGFPKKYGIRSKIRMLKFFPTI